jgi:hypothetical protein
MRDFLTPGLPLQDYLPLFIDCSKGLQDLPSYAADRFYMISCIAATVLSTSASSIQ